MPSPRNKKHCKRRGQQLNIGQDIEGSAALRRVGQALLIGLVWQSLGVAFYHLYEGWSLSNSVYMVIITMSTVGFSEVGELSESGRLFTALFILVGTVINVLILARLAQFLFEGELRELLGTRKKEKLVNQLNKHSIICGFGRLGHHVAHELQEKGADLLILEKKVEIEFELKENNYLYYIGDATEDVLLQHCGIERAATLLALLPSDADNLYLTITARELNPDIHIIALADTESARRRLLRSGANEVISPYIVTGKHIAEIIGEKN